MKIPFENKGKIKISGEKRKKLKLHYEQSYTTKNVKGSPSGRRKMVPDGNHDVPRGMKRLGNGKCVGKHI